MNTTHFRDRACAGQLLAGELERYANRDDVITLALPRGGVPVAYEVATHLKVKLDVMVVRKLGVPGCEELAMGAIASGGARVVHEAVMQAMHVSRADFEHALATQLMELHRRELAYRHLLGAPQVKDKTVILVDDGIATGSTLRAAVHALRHQLPRRIIIVAPVASSVAAQMLKRIVDETVILLKPEAFHSVGQWYVNFPQTTDEEVVELLAQSASHTPEPVRLPPS